MKAGTFEFKIAKEKTPPQPRDGANMNMEPTNQGCGVINGKSSINGPQREEDGESANNGEIIPAKKITDDAGNVVPVQIQRMPNAAKSGSVSAEKLTRKISTARSILELSKTKIKDDDTLLGDRYLCRGGGMIIAAPSGQGKSSMSFQMAALFATGREAFGIKPARPLRIMVIQAEDDEGDCIEMSWVIDHLGLSDTEKDVIGVNTLITPVNSEVGDGFLRLMECYLEIWQADIVIINPYTAYLGADDKDSQANTLFLRNGLNPILTKHRCAAIVIHHTPKTNFNGTHDYKPSDWMYRGAGSAIITNWARAYLVIDPTAFLGLYWFIAAKRGKRIGWQTWERYFKHSSIPGIMRWEEASETEASQAKQTSAGVKIVDSEKLLKLVPVLDPEKKTILIQKGVAATGCGRDKVTTQFEILEYDGKIYPRSIENTSGGRPFVGWAKTRKPDLDPQDEEPVSKKGVKPKNKQGRISRKRLN